MVGLLFAWFVIGVVVIPATAIFYSKRRAFLIASIWVLPVAIPRALHDMSSNSATKHR